MGGHSSKAQTSVTDIVADTAPTLLTNSAACNQKPMSKIGIILSDLHQTVGSPAASGDETTSVGATTADHVPLTRTDAGEAPGPELNNESARREAAVIEIQRRQRGRSARNLTDAMRRSLQQADTTDAVEAVMCNDGSAAASDVPHETAAQPSSIRDLFRITARAADHVVSLAAHGAVHASQLGRDVAAQSSARNEQYNITGQAANLASQGFSEAARRGQLAAQFGKNAAAQASAWKEEHNITGKDAKTVVKGVVSRMDRLARHSQQAITQSSAINEEESSIDGHASRRLKCAASRAASISRSAAQQLSAWNEKHQITEQAAAAAAQGASHAAAHLSDFDQKYQIKDNVKHFVAKSAERFVDAVAPLNSQEDTIEIDDTVARPQHRVWCC